jgi:7-cyano-7-deazaguanine synthase
VTVVIFSGGLDSTVLLSREVSTLGYGMSDGAVVALSFNYGQRHGSRELEAAAEVCATLDVEHVVVDLTAVGALLSGSALTDPAVDVPDGHYAEESMRSTIVPNRNAVMVSVATAYAVAHGHKHVLFGAHAGDHYVYPDCRPEFVKRMNLAMVSANAGVAEVYVVAPFVEMTKTDVVRHGDRIGAPMALSWSCYNGRSLHCGTCGTCTERREAFHDAGVDDPTEYEVAPPLDMVAT